MIQRTCVAYVSIFDLGYLFTADSCRRACDSSIIVQGHFGEFCIAGWSESVYRCIRGSGSRVIGDTLNLYQTLLHNKWNKISWWYAGNDWRDILTNINIPIWRLLENVWWIFTKTGRLENFVPCGEIKVIPQASGNKTNHRRHGPWA